MTYVDEIGIHRDALTICVFPQGEGYEPVINVVLVSANADKGDSFGRQIERITSVVHKSCQMPPIGIYWE